MSTYDEVTLDELLSGTRSEDPTLAVIDELRGFALATAPAPSARLAELLANGCAPVVPGADAAGGAMARDRAGALLAALPATEVARRTQVGRLVAAAVVAGGATLGLTGMAAANDVLPAPAQSVVGGIMNAITPFHVDSPRRQSTPPASTPSQVSPAADRFDGAGALPRPQPRRAETHPGSDSGAGSSVGSARRSTAPARQTSRSAATQRAQRHRAGSAAAQAKRSRSNTSTLQRIEQRIKRQLRHRYPPGIWHLPPITLPGLGFGMSAHVTVKATAGSGSASRGGAPPAVRAAGADTGANAGPSATRSASDPAGRSDAVDQPGTPRRP